MTGFRGNLRRLYLMNAEMRVPTLKSNEETLYAANNIALNGRIVTEFLAGPEHLNQRGTLHGGFISHLAELKVMKELATIH
ncbi:unnamed protein product [Leptidea sinapis]|uniref:Thioesterase domain-containing protein n=1 Tax=Leptidea sinapis TaxID=189913 RepID=A0A5E4QTN8_9NEOP|nr:unnamed protein product [Leptidea sinapis]